MIIDTIRLDTISLTPGEHNNPTDGLCLMEAVTYVCHLDHTDCPRCVSPVLGEFGRNLNDVLPVDRRQDLKQLIPNLIGTADDGLDETRSYMALDWLIRVYTPTWLALADLTEDAQTLRDLSRIVHIAAVERARPAVLAGREKATAAWATARVAAGDRAQAVWAAAEFVWNAAGDAAWDAFQVTAWNMAEFAAYLDMGEVVWDIAGAAARAAVWVDLAAAETDTATSDMINSTVSELQNSAIALFRSMIKPHP